MKAVKLSSFCMQISFLLEAGIPLDDGLMILSEDVETEEEKKMLVNMAEDVEIGVPIHEAMEKTGQFPDYLLQMSKIGQETGNLEVIMQSLAEYYEKESTIAQTLKNAITYPFIMVTMLMVVLFVILTKVMPIFEGVYNQLGAELSPITKSAVHVGSVLSGVALVCLGLLALIVGGVMFLSKKGYQMQGLKRFLTLINENSRVAATLAKRRVAAVMAIAVKGGLEIDAGVEMATKLIPQKLIQAKLEICKNEIEQGKSVYEALKETKLFTSMDLQMIKVGTRSGKSDVVFEELAKKYENEVDAVIDNSINRFEPTMVVILAIVVGLILLSVMMPMVGIMASIG